MCFKKHCVIPCNIVLYLIEGEGRGEKGRGVKMLHTYIHTDIQTYRHTEPLTKRVLEEHSLLKKKEY